MQSMKVGMALIPACSVGVLMLAEASLWKAAPEFSSSFDMLSNDGFTFPHCSFHTIRPTSVGVE